MSAITPSTELYLLKCPLAIDNANQLTFENAEAQYEYFMSLEKLYVDDFTYQRKNNSIRYPGLMDDLIEYNYCMYKNDNYSDKWFYAYINNIQYINDNVSLISIKTDVFQSWQFDLTYKQSFVVREHTNDDSFGANLEPEQLETGEYQINIVDEIDLGSPVILICATRDPSDLTVNGGGIYGGIYCGYKMYAYRANSPLVINAVLKRYQNGYTDSVIGIAIFPEKLCFPDSNWNNGQEVSQNINMTAARVNIPPSLAGYEPRNKKLLQYPYNYLVIDNKCGAQKVYQYEKCEINRTTLGNFIYFDIQGVANLSSSWLITPRHYNLYTIYEGVTNPTDNAIPGAKFPQCGWQSDAYTNWLTQQSKNLTLAEDRALMTGNKSMLENELELFNAENKTKSAPLIAASNLLGSIFQAGVTGNALAPFASFENGYNEIMKAASNEVYLNRNKEFIQQGYDLDIRGIQGEKYAHSFTAGSASGQVATGDAMFSIHSLNPLAYRMSVRQEFAKKIDKYFDMFGYATNKMKLPNITGRTNWNYIKTARSNIIANIPQIDLQEIKKMFDNGITLWHNPSTFLDYSRSNEII